MTNVEKISSAFISQLLLSEPWSPGRLYDLSMGLQNRLEKCRSLSRRLLSEHLRPVQFLNEAITSWCTERSSRTVSELCQKLSSKGFQAASGKSHLVHKTHYVGLTCFGTFRVSKLNISEQEHCNIPWEWPWTFWMSKYHREKWIHYVWNARTNH